VVESRAVWKDLGFRRIGKSLEMEIGLGDDVKRLWVPHGAHMVYTCMMEIKSDDVEQWSRVKGMTSGHM